MKIILKHSNQEDNKPWRKVWKYTKISVLFALPLVLWILPASFFDQGQSISIFELLGVGEYAYSKGMTKAVMHLMHFDFKGAAAYNKISFVVLPLLFIVWLKWLFNEFGIIILKGF